MYQPIINFGNMKKIDIDAFAGLNLTDTISNEEFSDMKNIAPSYPYIASRTGQSVIDCFGGAAKKIISMEQNGKEWSFTGIGEAEGKTRFYYKNKLIERNGGKNYTLTAHSAVRMGERIYIFPDNVYFDMTNMETGLHNMGCDVSVTGAELRSSKSNDVITNYINSKSTSTWSSFKKGDSILISGCTQDKNNTVTVKNRGMAVAADDIVSVIVEKIEGSRLYVQCHNSAGAAVALKSASSNIIVKKFIPEMNYVCVHNNRLFGCDIDGRYIYASKLGNGCDFNSFAGLSTDSWWSEVATDGAFTGIVSYQNHVYAFKSFCFHEVYGDKPSNFKIPYVTKTGCVDGRSITELDGTLYFAGADGFYAYDGGAAKNISVKLNIAVSEAVGGHDSENIYMYADNMLYLYNTTRRMWYKYDDTPIDDIFCTDGNLFFAAAGDLFLQGGCNSGVNWSLTSKLYNTGFIKTNIVNVWLAVSLGAGAYMRVAASTDGGPFRLLDTVYADAARFVRVPMRMHKCDTFQLKLSGNGDFMLYGIRFENRVGGKNTRRNGGML